MNFFRKTTKVKKGYTLLELLIYIGIIAITLTIIMSLLVKVVESNRKGVITRETQENARLIMERMSFEIRWAGIVVEALDDELSLGTRNGPVRFFLSGEDNDRLYVEKGGAERELTSGKVKVSNLNFTNITSENGSKSIKVILEIENRSSSEKSSYTSKTKLQSVIAVRN